MTKEMLQLLKVSRRSLLNTSKSSLALAALSAGAIATTFSSCTRSSKDKPFFVFVSVEDDELDYYPALKLPQGATRVVFVLISQGWVFRFSGPDSNFNSTPAFWTEGDKQKTVIADPGYPQGIFFETKKIPKPGKYLSFELAVRKIDQIQNPGKEGEVIIMTPGGIGGGGCIEC